MLIRFRFPSKFNVTRRLYSLFDLEKIIAEDDTTRAAVRVAPVPEVRWAEAAELVRREYFPHHALVRARNFRSLGGTHALDEYLLGLLQRGDSLYASTENGDLAGVCINLSTSPADVDALEAFAACRQVHQHNFNIEDEKNAELKELLNFTAKLQAAPKFWAVYEKQKVFEIRMLAVAEGQRRRGVGSKLARRAAELARDRGCSVVRMDCFQHIGCKVAERCEMRCLSKLRLSELINQDGHPFVPLAHSGDRELRVYVASVRAGKADNWLAGLLGRARRR